MGRLARLSAAATALGLVGLALSPPLRASIFGEENVTLVEQLSELMKIREEATKISDGITRVADATDDFVNLYRAAEGGWDELAAYTTDAFLRDFKNDIYDHYPGFEILLEGTNSRRIRRWQDSRARAPGTAYEMISAVFGDLTDPLKDQERAGKLNVDRARVWRYEAAGALSLAADAEAWTKSADKDARELARLASDARTNPGQAQLLSARALALIAVQQSHVIRLLSRHVRFEGVRGAMHWAETIDGLKGSEEFGEEMDGYLGDTAKPPRMMRFATPW